MLDVLKIVQLKRVQAFQA